MYLLVMEGITGAVGQHQEAGDQHQTTGCTSAGERGG